VAPSLGGTLNATTEQAADDTRASIEDDQNKTILSHSYLDASPAGAPEPGGAAGSSYVLGHDEPAPVVAPEATHAVSGHEMVIQPPSNPIAATPLDLGLPMPPPLPDFSAAPAPSSAYAVEPSAQPPILGDILAPEPAAPQLQQAPLVPPSPASLPVANDPSQFQIPAQQ
jgi:hypothetical protein